MMDLHPEPSALVGSLQLESAQRGQVLDLTLRGSAELRGPEALSQALLQWHALALSLGVREVFVDFRAVEFMNSSALSAFLQWFSQLEATPGAYKVCLVYDTAVRWQRGSISALSAFAVDHVTTSNVAGA